MAQRMKKLDGEATTDTPSFMTEAYRPHQPEPERAIVAAPLIRSDKDNWTKTILRQAFVMSVVDLDIVWDVIERKGPYSCIVRPEACKLKFEDPEDFMGHYFQEIYRINMRVEDAFSLDAFVKVTMTPYAMGVQTEDVGSGRMKEGSRK